MTSTFVAALLASLAWSGSGLAAGVPTIDNLKATPKRFCAKRTSTCHHVGTLLTFKLSANAKVRVDVWPRFGTPSYGYMELNKRLQAGDQSIHLRDGRLKPGPWDVRVQGTGAVGTGPIAKIRVRVVKHD